MNKSSQMMFKVFAVVFFLLAVASVLATLFAASGSSRSPGLFMAVLLAGLGKWLLGKSKGKSARQTFGRVVDVVKTDNELESPDKQGSKAENPESNGLSMTTFEVHTNETAPAQSAEVLSGVEKTFGFIPNLMGVLAESPAALKAYVTMRELFDESSLSQTERQVVNLAASRFNQCHYCVAAHSVFSNLQRVPANVVKAIRNDHPIADSKLEVLREFTTAVVEKRGWVSDENIAVFLAAGYTKAQILEVILGISFKTLSNYTNHISDTPLDDAFAPHAWAPITDRLVS